MWATSAGPSGRRNENSHDVNRCHENSHAGGRCPCMAVFFRWKSGLFVFRYYFMMKLRMMTSTTPMAHAMVEFTDQILS